MLVLQSPKRQLKWIRLSQQQQKHFIGLCPSFRTYTEGKSSWRDTSLIEGLTGSTLAVQKNQ